MAASCLAAFDILEREPERIERLWDNTRYFKAALAAAGFDTGASETPITPIMVGEAKAAHEFSAALFEEGLFCDRHRLPHGARRAGRASAPSSRPPTPAINSTAPSLF